MTADITLEQRINRLEAIESIKQLKFGYFNACDMKKPELVRECFVEGDVLIDYGAIGAFNNREELVKVFSEVGCHDYMVEMHHGQNPQILVGDGETATGTWGLYYYLINTQEQTVTQLGGIYQDEYRKVGGDWKISRTVFTANSTVVTQLKGEGDSAILFAGKPA